MERDSNGRLLVITKLLVYLMLALLAVLALLLVVGAVALPFNWAEITQAIGEEYPKIDAVALLPKIYAILWLGLGLIGLAATILAKLLAIIGSLAKGDPFILANAARLKIIGWLMVAAQILGGVLAFAARDTADLFGRNNVDAGPSLNGILAILLVFILAGIFERGAAMREELEGTV
ncbi:MAG TPA: DUF2975 domain-containing protein [Sphingorhabdus sp.]|jgi:hypothetical protein|nr:DUF2975 domain-containing protein [Sphingorhabdus sp.]